MKSTVRYLVASSTALGIYKQVSLLLRNLKKFTSEKVSAVGLSATAGTIYMFDCGEGVQQQLQRAGFRQTSIDNIFITHMHGDHVSSV